MTRDVLMSVNGDDKELQELKIFKDGVTVEEYRLLEDDELKVNGIAEEVKVGQGGTVEAPAVQHIPQQQPQGSIACWERFLHLRSLKVLLVENDDSTRHVVTALLRNCSYEVIEAANGLQAWKMLEDLTNHIDLILTEVAMPCFSGIGLLCKIMSHQMLKNIPVIMMSSHDSMGIVFKCLSKGAVDFLVKPIRKNELKNLWQHVWRRCHSSSGSGSESGTQTQKSVKSKSTEKSDNNTGSNDEDDNGSVGLNNGDESDNVSGTQSSWTKQAVEVDSPKQVPQCDQMAEYPDSNCAQFDHSNAKKSGNKMIPIATRDCPEKTEQLGAKHSIPLDVGLSKFNEQISRGQLDLNCENPSGNLRCKGPSAPDAITSTSDSQMQGGEVEAPNRRPIPSDIENKATNNIEELPSLDLSLKRFRGVKDAGTKTKDERNVISRSDLLAFSRYNASSNRKKSPTGCVGIGSNFPHDNSLVVTKKDLSREIQSHSSGNPPSLYSNGPCYNIDMGSTTNNAFTKTAVISEPAMRGTHNDSPTQDLQHHFEHHNSIANNMQHQLPPDHDNSTLKTLATAAPHCGLSNAEVLVEGTIQNYSINRSASGSNNGSNGESGNSSAVNARGKNLESDNGIAGNSGSGDASGSGSENTNRVDQNKTSQREAALTKFRQKRKERCFRKKVRYQSRKNLAEQRPRFRGQFVRQPSNGNASEATGS